MSYAPIRVSVLRGDQQIGFDCYVEINGKNIHYLRKGDNFEGSRLAKLKQKKLKRMFIREEEEPLYREYMSRNIEMAYSKDSKQTIENRTQIVQGLQQACAEAMFENPTDSSAYNEAKENSQKFTDFLLAEDQAVKSMLAIENVDQSVAHHGVTVASLAVRIAKLVGYDNQKNLQMMALGGLIHDVGHYISLQNITRPVSEFTAEEIAVYHTHATTGAQKLKDLNHMDQHVIQIIAEHEECVNGSGFPKKLTENKLNPMSVFVGSANIFDRLVTFERMPQKNAVKRLMSAEYLGRYPLAHLNALKSIVNS